MHEVARLMTEARGRLRLGLAALQTPGTPREVAEGAGPLAHAVGLLDQLERGGFAHVGHTYPELLSTLQRALHQLQWTNQQHPSLSAAVDHVAGALGLVFTVKAPAGPASRAASAAPVASARPAPETQPHGPARPLGAGPNPAGAPLVERAIAAAKQRPLPRPDKTPTPQPVVSPNSPKPAAPDGNAAVNARRRDAERLGNASTDATSLLRMDASLGANSPSNFYRGFDGDDVLQHGGLFVATYNVPEIDQRVAVRVTFPDGREFMAQGIVKWRRLAPPGGSHSPDSPPGFGLRFEQVPNNARQLVERYVKNREPLFHDD